MHPFGPISPWRLNHDSVANAQIQIWRVNYESTRIDCLLREFDQDADVYIQFDTMSFASQIWVGMMDTASLFDEKEDFQLVISPWEPQDYRKPKSDYGGSF